jgi:hypothetical protein
VQIWICTECERGGREQEEESLHSMSRRKISSIGNCRPT